MVVTLLLHSIFGAVLTLRLKPINSTSLCCAVKSCCCIDTDGVASSAEDGVQKTDLQENVHCNSLVSDRDSEYLPHAYSGAYTRACDSNNTCDCNVLPFFDVVFQSTTGTAPSPVFETPAATVCYSDLFQTFPEGAPFTCGTTHIATTLPVHLASTVLRI